MKKMKLLQIPQILLDIFNDVVIVQDEENNKFEVYMNNIIKPSEG